MKAFIKLHKVNTPIWSVVSRCNAPTYRTAKFVTRFLNSILDLPYTFNVYNSVKLI
jgi:hypothetical protein